MEELITKLVKIPVATKVGVLVGAALLVTAGNFFLLPGVSDIYTKTEGLHRKHTTLEAEFTKKQQVANNLNQYKAELEVVEQKLKEALTEMPEEVQIDTLLTQFSELAKKAGLSLRALEPSSESISGDFYRIPIKMSVSGNYHEIAVFLDSVSKLKRIVNVSEIEFSSPKAVADKVLLTASYQATTFRFAGEKKGGTKGKGRHGRGGRK